MLAYLLALMVGLGSFALYMAAFFFPEVHRKNDFIWSGVGLFYALVLWVCAGRITGGVLLGQTASIVLLGWFAWQTLTLRRQVAPADQQTAIPSQKDLKSSLSNFSNAGGLAKLQGQVGQQFSRLKSSAGTALDKSTKRSPKAKEKPYVPLTPDDFASARRGTELQAFLEDDDTELEAFIDEDGEEIALPVAESSTSEVSAIEATPWTAESVQAESRVPATVPQPQVTPSQAKPTSPIAGITEFLRNLLPGNQKKPESKPIYVRKQFREPDPEEFELEEPAAIESTADVPVSDQRDFTANESTIEDTTPETPAEQPVTEPSPVKSTTPTREGECLVSPDATEGEAAVREGECLVSPDQSVDEVSKPDAPQAEPEAKPEPALETNFATESSPVDVNIGTFVEPVIETAEQLIEAIESPTEEPEAIVEEEIPPVIEAAASLPLPATEPEVSELSAETPEASSEIEPEVSELPAEELAIEDTPIPPDPEANFLAKENDELIADSDEEATDSVLGQTVCYPLVDTVDDGILQEDTVPADAIVGSEIIYEASKLDLDDVEPEIRLEPIRPKPPSPELVAEALEDAREKQVPASPPISDSDTPNDSLF